MIELHGNLFANKWLNGCGRCDEATAIPGDPPRCSLCGALMRPGVVWFGEDLPRVARFRAEHAAENADLCLGGRDLGAGISGSRAAGAGPGPRCACRRGELPSHRRWTRPPTWCCSAAAAGACLPLLWPQSGSEAEPDRASAPAGVSRRFPRPVFPA
ncbi:Sir2 family NAD-dependent protein deacetylase [Cupriavidus basilensis]